MEETKKVKEVKDTNPISSSTVEIDKEKLQQLLLRIQRLESAADKRKLAHFDDRNKKQFSKQVKVRTYDGKLITGWRTIRDVVEKNSNGVWHEDQVIELQFEDETSLEVPYRVYVVNYKSIPGTVEKEIVDPSGHKEVLIKLENGRQITLGIEFIN